MIAISVNPNKEWRGHFLGNYEGNIWASLNIDLEKNPGRILLSDKMRRIANVSSLGTEVIRKLIRTNANATDQWWGIMANNMIRNADSTITAGTWVDDSALDSPTDPRDMEIHESNAGEQRLVVTRAAEIAILNVSGADNAWDPDWGSTGTRLLTLTSQTFHPIARLKRLLAIGDKVSTGTTNIPVIHTIDRNDVGSSSRLAFAAEYTVRVIVVSSNRFWIGLQHDLGGRAKIVEWDGFSLDYNNEYELVGSYPLTGFVVRNIPYFITETGHIFKFNGGGFDKVQDFDLGRHRASFSSDVGEETGILPYCNYVDGDIVYLNISVPIVDQETTAFTGGVQRARSGIWIFNTKTLNLYHHMGYGEHVTGGTDINYGCSHIEMPGTVIKATIGGEERVIVATGAVFTGGTTWKTDRASGIYRSIQGSNWVSNNGRNRGYFITPYIPIQGSTGILQGVWVKFKRFLSDKAASPATPDRIIVKWRCRDPLTIDTDVTTFFSFLQAEGDWASTTTFACVVPTGVAVDDEVEIMTGDNAGCSFRISALSATPDGSTSITVTIEEAAPTDSTDTFLCRFDNWETEAAINTTTRGSQWIPCTASSSKNEGEFIQLKIEMRGFAVEIDDIIPVYKSNQTLEM